MNKILKILYINVIEQNAGWGAETFINKEFQAFGHNVTNLDFRKHRRVLATKLNEVADFDVLFLQRGDRFPIYLLKACNRPLFFWASELVSRNRVQNILLKSNLFDHIFVRSEDCMKRVIKNQWVAKQNISIMLSGFDEELHKKEYISKDIDILFVGSMLSRRKKILRELQTEFNIRICKAFGKEMSNLFNRSKIVLNIHAEEFLDTETRIYESLGCGAFVISEKLSSENPFIPNMHYIEVNNIDEMKNQINYYLDNPIERENIAQNGYKEAKSKHSYQKRAEQLVNKFNQYVTVSSQETFNTKKLTFYSNIERVANSFRKTYK